MHTKYTLYLVGIINISTGLVGLLTGSTYIRGEDKVSITGAIIWLISGIVLFTIGLKMKKPIEFTKCPKCKEGYIYNNLKNGMCPNCNIQTIDIDIYFQKFPNEIKWDDPS